MAHPNEELVRTVYGAFGRGDMEALFSALSDDIVFHVPGRTPVSGDHRGKEQLSAFFEKVGERSAGTVHLDVHDVVANDQHVLGLANISGQPKGQPLSYHVVHVWHVREGKLAEMWEHPEQAGFDAFWG